MTKNGNLEVKCCIKAKKKIHFFFDDRYDGFPDSETLLKSRFSLKITYKKNKITALSKIKTLIN